MKSEDTNSLHKIYNPIYGLDNILLLAQECQHTDPLKVNLLCLGFKEDLPKEKELAETLFLELINYCIPHPVLKKRKELALSEGKSEARLYSELIRDARSLFMKYKLESSLTKNNEETQEKFDQRVKNANVRYGEVGELISYCIAIHFLKAAQLVSKMALKTSSEMPVFGLDGIHATIDSDGSLNVFYLESKMTREFNSGSEQFSKSVSGFESDRHGRRNEYRIIQDLSNLESLDGEERIKAVNYFDPYSSESSNVRERFIGIIAYSEKIYNNKLKIDDNKPLSIHTEHFIKNYISTYEDKTNTLTENLIKSGATPQRCRVYILALPDVDSFKLDFAKELSGEHFTA
ncbi:DUF1837 domain-containing protein [Pectobacterium brasiliense]|uniref:HamA C-terminal domain-containing protein n=1 Tax=Pectobacterium brasiliense TaxID=180957 RepID=UPI00196927B7|nr:DUF1837 domain-containing protein [Pectobacterium brasiliense]MBN3100190.1 DUF1837 domain-containing protein [Pectobacterium brasiliense]MBN3167272.1 DUF1837 domain-containing protein [Pectobacterium brasiliense]